MSSRVFVTGAGVISPVGLGRKAFWEALLRGEHGFAPVKGFDTSELGRNIAAEVKDFRPRDHLTAAEARRTGRCSAYLIAASRMALEDAGLVGYPLVPERASVVLGTTMGEVDVMSRLDAAWIQGGREAVSDRELPRYGTTLLPIHVARTVGARGLVLTLPAACAAGNYAIAFAADLIRKGRADVVITGAAELLEQVEYTGFARLGAMAPEHPQPFDANRQGLILGEGGAIMVLESEAHVVRRGGTPLAEVGGYGIACDAYHITRPHPEAEGFLKAIRDALRSSGVGPEQVDFVNAHGTATKANDAVEAKALREIFGARRVPVSSVKSMLGHCMGAASALEAVTCLETLQSGWYPPTINYETPDPECDLEVVANVARRGPHDIVLNNSLAFGGYDAAVLFARPGVLPADAPALAS